MCILVACFLFALLSRGLPSLFQFVEICLLKGRLCFMFCRIAKDTQRNSRHGICCFLGFWNQAIWVSFALRKHNTMCSQHVACELALGMVIGIFRHDCILLYVGRDSFQLFW